MKKVLSIILAIMMIATAVPMAFAADCAHQFDADSMVRPNILGDGYYICQLCSEKVTLKRADYSDFDGIYVRVTSADDHVYSSDEIAIAAYDTYMETFDQIVTYLEINGYGSYEEFLYLYNLHEGEQELLDVITAILVSGGEKLEQYDDDILFDGTAFVEGEYYLNLICSCFTDEEIEAASEKLILRSEETVGLISYKYADVLARVETDPTSVTKEEYADAMAGMGNYMAEAANCLAAIHNLGEYADNGDGTHKAECSLCMYDDVKAHTWGEYVSNGDATPEADGTKTAECTACDATDTVVDEGSKIPVDEPEDEPADEPEDEPEDEPAEEGNFFTKIIAKIRSFFDKIAEFFKNLFA